MINLMTADEITNLAFRAFDRLNASTLTDDLMNLQDTPDDRLLASLYLYAKGDVKLQTVCYHNSHEFARRDISDGLPGDYDLGVCATCNDAVFGKDLLYAFATQRATQANGT